jgi:hypothetical protein
MDKPVSSPLVDDELAARYSLGVIELFQAEASSAQIQAAAKSAFQWADYCLDLLETASPLPQPLACQPGCDLCCYNQVELTTPEALRLGSFLAARFPPDSLRLLLERVAGSRDRQAGKTKEQLAALRAEFPCPLLADGRCSVYEVRPLMCRAMHSLDVAACRQEFAHPGLSVVPFYAHRHIIPVSLSQGLVDACLALGYQPGPVELLWGIQTYFSHPESAQKWLAGEKVF